MAYELLDELYLLPTPAGAYYAVSSRDPEPPRRFLRMLMNEASSQKIDRSTLSEWTGIEDEQAALQFLFRLQNLAWVEGFKEEQTNRSGALDAILPPLLEAVAGNGKAMLADAHGFYVASHGFPHEAAEELSALSADLASLHERHHGLLHGNLGVANRAWGLIDAAGNSQIGFWPIYAGTERFVLVVAGMPRFHQRAFTELIWGLYQRYGDSDQGSEPHQRDT